MAPKSEPVTPAKSTLRKRAAPVDSSSDDDSPLASSPVKQSAAMPIPGTSKVSKVNGHRAAKDESDDKRSSAPIKKKRAPVKKLPAQKKMKVDPDASEPSSEGEESRSVKKEKMLKKRKSKAKEETDADAEDGKTPKPMKRRATTKKVKDEANGSETPQPKKKRGKVKDEAEEEEEVFRWWESQQNNNNGEVKWQTLEHSGVIFPPPYEPLPSDVKMRYKGMCLLCSSCWSGGSLITIHYYCR